MTDWYPLEKLGSSSSGGVEAVAIYPLVPIVNNTNSLSSSVGVGGVALNNNNNNDDVDSSVRVGATPANNHALDWVNHEAVVVPLLTNHVADLNHKMDGLVVNHKSDGLALNSNDTNGRNQLPNFLLCLQSRNEHVRARQALFKEVRRPGRSK